MRTLVIHVPKSKAASNKWLSFEDTMTAGVADDCAIYQDLLKGIEARCPVVLLDKERGARAEGRLTDLVPTTKAKNNVQRYNVCFDAMKRVEYKPERLNRCGIALI